MSRNFPNESCVNFYDSRSSEFAFRSINGKENNEEKQRIQRKREEQRRNNFTFYVIFQIPFGIVQLARIPNLYFSLLNAKKGGRGMARRLPCKLQQK